jgi:hypothetical protein
MISLLVSVVLLFNVESSVDDKKQASSIKKTVQIIKAIHGVKWGGYMKYIMMFVFVMVLGCENIKQSIGISTNPFSSKFEEKTKLNYKIVFGMVRNEKDDDD